MLLGLLLAFVSKMATAIIQQQLLDGSGDHTQAFGELQIVHHCYTIIRNVAILILIF